MPWLAFLTVMWYEMFSILTRLDLREVSFTGVEINFWRNLIRKLRQDCGSAVGGPSQ